MIQAGRLRHRVQIQIPVSTQDQQSGDLNADWQTVATVWAAIEPLSGREFIAAQAEASRINTRITIRYRTLHPDARLYHMAKDEYYNIEGVLGDKDSGLEYLTLPCSKGLRYMAGEEVIAFNLELPFIVGNMAVGQVVSASNGLWANNPDSFEYQWYLNGTPLSGQDSQNLTIPNNPGQSLTVGLIATNSAGSSTETESMPRNII